MVKIENTIYFHINTISTDFDLAVRVIHYILYSNIKSDVLFATRFLIVSTLQLEEEGCI